MFVRGASPGRLLCSILSFMQEHTEDSSARFWDKKARGYAKSAIADTDAYEKTLARVGEYLKADDQVLEIGCGTASTALSLAPSVGKMFASDVSSQMIDIGKEKAKAQGCENIELLVAGAMDPQLTARQYDVVLAFNVLHLVDDPVATVARAYELLKPGGLFISKTFCLPSTFSIKVGALRLILPLMQLLKQAPSVHFMKVPELDKIVLDAGFSLKEQGAYPENPPRRFLVAQKP